MKLLLSEDTETFWSIMTLKLHVPCVVLVCFSIYVDKDSAVMNMQVSGNRCINCCSFAFEVCVLI